MADPTAPGANAPAATADLTAVLQGYLERAEAVPFGEHDPQDVPRLVAAVRAVLGRHRAAGEDVPSFCLSCGDVWPCPTVQAVARELGARP